MTTKGDGEGDLTGTIAKHYNELQESGLEERTKSRIFYQRNFNNWMKSMAISEVLQKVKQEKRFNSQAQSVVVLDLCAGKGGDLQKWKKGDIDHIVCADIAATSVEQCKSRYNEMLDRAQKMFSAEFIAADCTKQRLKELYKNPDIQFDVVSCQFSLHYGFESLPQAEMMLQNACECLKPGGYFIGSIPNAYELVKRLRAADGMEFGNEVYKISFDGSDKTTLPLFGARYHFMLEGVVNCPEFLVYFPLLEKMVEKYNLKLVYRSPFADFFNEKIQLSDGRGLIGRMQGLEPYPADEDVDLMSSDPKSYAYIKDFYEKIKGQQAADTRGDYSRREKAVKVGTLSEPEWEATTVYQMFEFQRCSDVSQRYSDVPPSARKRKLEDSPPS